MIKDDVLHMRIDSKLKESIRQYASDNGYDDVSKCIVDILRDRVDPVRRNEVLKQHLIELLRDPQVRADLGLK